MIKSDNKIRTLFKETQIKTNANLEHRIMQRIMTEKALVKKAKPATSPWRLLSAFIGMHIAIALLISILYFILGKEGMQNNSIYLTTTLITFVCGMFFLISMLDEKRRFKHKKVSTET